MRHTIRCPIIELPVICLLVHPPVVHRFIKERIQDIPFQGSLDINGDGRIHLIEFILEEI